MGIVDTLQEYYEKASKAEDDAALGRSNAPAQLLRGAPADPNYMASGLRAYQPQAMDIQRRAPTDREMNPNAAYGWGTDAPTPAVIGNNPMFRGSQQTGQPPPMGGGANPSSWMDRARSSAGRGGGGYRRPQPAPQGNPMFAGGSQNFDESAGVPVQRQPTPAPSAGMAAGGMNPQQRPAQPMGQMRPMGGLQQPVQNPNSLQAALRGM